MVTIVYYGNQILVCTGINASCPTNQSRHVWILDSCCPKQMSPTLWYDKRWSCTFFWTLVMVSLAHLGQSLLWSSDLGVHWVYPEGWGRVQLSTCFYKSISWSSLHYLFNYCCSMDNWIIELSKSLIWLLLLHGFWIYLRFSTILIQFLVNFGSFWVVFRSIWCSNCTWAQFRPISVVFPAFLLFLWY